MYGIKVEFTDKTQPIYWSNFQSYVLKSTNSNYSAMVSLTYHELQRFGGMLNPLYAYRSGVNTLHFMTNEQFTQFVEKWSNYEHT
jgi:hypothetical protein